MERNSRAQIVIPKAVANRESNGICRLQSRAEVHRIGLRTCGIDASPGKVATDSWYGYNALSPARSAITSNSGASNRNDPGIRPVNRGELLDGGMSATGKESSAQCRTARWNTN